MIIKTFDNNIDKISSKWGMLGKSFNEINTTIYGKINEINKAFQATDDLISSIKNSNSIQKKANPNKELISSQLIDIEKIYPSITDEAFSSIFEKLLQLNKNAVNGSSAWQNYFSSLKEGQEWQIEFIQNTDLQKASLSDVKNAYNQARKAAIAHNQELQNMSFSAKAGAIALKALSIAGNMILFTLISKGIELVVTGFDNWIHRVEKANEAMKDAVGEYESAKAKLENVNSELEEQNKIIDELLAKDRLTYAEKGELESLQAITQELLLQQDIEKKRTENASKEAADKAADAYQKQYGKYDKTKDALEDKLEDINFPVPDGSDDVLGMVAAYIRARELLERSQKEYNDALQNGDDTGWFAENLQFYIDMSDEYSQMLDTSVSDLQEKRLALADEYHKAVEKQASGLEPLTSSEQDIIEAYEAIYDMIRLVYEYTDPNTWKSMQIENVFHTGGIEKTKEELIEMAKNGTLDANVIQSYSKLSDALEQNKISASELCDELKALAELESLAESEALAELEDDLQEPAAEPLAPTISSSIRQLAAQLEPQFARLGEAYRAIFAEDGFSRDAIDNSMLEGLRQSFAEIEEEAGISFDPAKLESFFAVLTDGSAAAEQVQTAFNDLATAYFRSTEILGQFNCETVEAIEKQLEEMGVTNAHEVALHALSEAKFRNVVAGYDLANASEETMVSLLNEGRAAGITEQMVYALTAAEIAFGNNELSVEEKIGKLKILAQAYGDVSASALATAVANDLAGGAEIDPEAALSQLMSQFGKYKVDMQFSPMAKKQPAPRVSSYTAKKEKTDWKDLLDKEATLLEKQLEAGVITFREYADRRRSIMEAYYRDGRVSAREYYDALEAMYRYRLSAYDKVLKTVTARIDRQIDSLEEEKEAAEKSYQIRIDAIQEEIDALEKSNQEKQTQIDLEKAQYALERAMDQRIRKQYNGTEFVYGSDPDSLREAREDLADKEFELHISGLKSQIEALEEEMDRATAVIDSNIEALKAYRDAWNEIPEEWENAQNVLLAGQILGADWENQVLSGRIDVLHRFRDQYVAAQQAMADAAWQSANEQIKAAQEAQKGASGSAGSAGTALGAASANEKAEIPDLSHRSSGLSPGIKNTDYSMSRSYLSQAVSPKSTNITADPKITVSFFKPSTVTPSEKARMDFTKLLRYHGGLDEGYVGAGISESERLHIFQDAASGGRDRAELKKDEFLAILRKQELVLTPEQQENILPYLYRARPSAVIDPITHLQPQSFAPPQNISTPVVQNINLTLPNVTNQSGYEHIKKELFQMQIDARQFAQRRQ